MELCISLQFPQSIDDRVQANFIFTEFRWQYLPKTYECLLKFAQIIASFEYVYSYSLNPKLNPNIFFFFEIPCYAELIAYSLCWFHIILPISVFILEPIKDQHRKLPCDIVKTMSYIPMYHHCCILFQNSKIEHTFRHKVPAMFGTKFCVQYSHCL